MNSAGYYIKTNRTFSTVRRSAWIITLAVAIGGQFYPPLGLLALLIMVSLIAMSLFKGRYWCGNFCPHGSFFDYLLLPVSRNIKIPGIFKSKIFISLFFLFFMFNMSIRFVPVIQNIGNVSLVNSVGTIFSNTYLMVLVTGGFLAVIFSSRTWCHFCPMGTMQIIFYKIGKKIGLTTAMDEKIAVEDKDLCHSCGKCSRVCPMQLTPHKELSKTNNKLDDERCIRCRTCVENCPAGVLHLANNKQIESLRKNADLDGFRESAY